MTYGFRLALIIALIACAISPAVASDYGPEIDSVLAAAGDNRAQLEQVLEHYAQQGDSLKFAAAQFLIANMREHSYVTYYMHDTSKTEVPFDVLAYPNYDSLQKAADAIEDARGTLDFSRHEPVYDRNVITAEFLIGQIDYAFMAWRDKPWAQKMPWEDFRDYVLPYRGSNEPLEPWRQAFWEKYRGLESGMTDPTDPVEAARLINEDIKSWFGFDPRYYYHPTDQGLEEMLQSHLGRCEDMTNVTIYAMRANGIGVTSDYTPYWANCGNNHAWNAVVTADGRVIPFMGAEANPGEYRLANKAAKVYRKTFSEQKQNLKFQENKQDSLPRWLAGKSYRDVTADYFDACDVTVAFAQPMPDSVSMAYLCVFNSGEWKPIHWARIDGQNATFIAMVGGIAYLPAIYLNQEIVPFGSPFLLNDDCSQTALVPQPDQPQSLSLVSTSMKKMVFSTEGIAQSFLSSGQEYELSYWLDGWQSVGTKTATDQPLVFDSVPSGALYWLVAKDSDQEERIFTVDSAGAQVWW
ncbi:MAG TPA: transglutaminase-like domain-containing protein [Acidobacteriota bacterium]|nr:transglutaminase-like domain-containing protein [Acidobacteriota bacterium]